MRMFPAVLTGLLAITSPIAVAGLEYAQAIANGVGESGQTSRADEGLNLLAVRPSATARINGSMSRLLIHADASINSYQSQISAFGQAQAEFTDTVTVRAPGVPPGTPLTLRIAFSVSGSADIDPSQGILCSARITAVSPNNAGWQRSHANSGIPTGNDPDGTVVFEFPVVEDGPTASDILVAFRAESVCGLAGSDIYDYYDSQASATLSVSFLPTETRLLDPQGRTLPVWTIESESGLDYGGGDEDPVLSSPTPSIAISPSSPDTIHLSWQTSELESYTVEASPDLVTWSPVATVTGNDLTATLELPRTGRKKSYRVRSAFATSFAK